MLMDYGADPLAEDAHGVSALYWAADGRYVAVEKRMSLVMAMVHHFGVPRQKIATMLQNLQNSRNRGWSSCCTLCFHQCLGIHCRYGPGDHRPSAHAHAAAFHAVGLCQDDDKACTPPENRV